MGMFFINGQMFDINTVNDTIQLGALEVWEIENISNMAHPMHIHGGSFFVLDRDGLPPPAWEQGPKDVVLVDAGSSVRVIMKFEDLTDGWPFMYHCHNLMHEDNMMMLQYIVEDQGTVIIPMDEVGTGVRTFPSPATDWLQFTCDAGMQEALVLDVHGAVVRRTHLDGATGGSLSVADLSRGSYLLVLRSGNDRWRSVFVKE
jgi:hypothetical protein